MLFDDLKAIVSLYRHFDQYKEYTDLQLLIHILPSYQLKQYKIHKQGDEVIAFNNWAFLSEDAENRYLATGILKPNDWRSGNTFWHCDVICVKDLEKVMSWTKTHFKNMLGINKPIKWLRVSQDKKIYRTSIRYTRESW